MLKQFALKDRLKCLLQGYRNYFQFNATWLVLVGPFKKACMAEQKVRICSTVVFYSAFGQRLLFLGREEKLLKTLAT